jgi:hypothetical protein
MCVPPAAAFFFLLFLFHQARSDCDVPQYNSELSPHSRRAASQLLSARVCVLDRVNMPLDSNIPPLLSRAVDLRNTTPPPPAPSLHTRKLEINEN